MCIRDRYIDIPAFEEKIEKIKYSDPQAAGAHTVTEEDLDINCHVNNCRYADMTSEILDRNDFQSFTINFLKETVVGDRIDMFTVSYTHLDVYKRQMSISADPRHA